MMAAGAVSKRPVVRHGVGGGERATAEVEAIAAAVAEVTGVPRFWILGGRLARRTRAVVRARGLVCWLARELTDLSWPAIGGAIGDRSSQWALTAARDIEASRTCEPGLADLLGRLMRGLASPHDDTEHLDA